MSHTLGEWKFTENSNIISERVLQRELAAEHHTADGEIAQCWSSEDGTLSKEECLANAQLMAAAPLLLDALQELVSYCEAEGFGNMEYAKKAIDKAIG